MAGSNSRKLREVLAKFWAYLRLFFKRGGLRVNSRKTGGVFNKNARRTGIFGLRPLDLDLMVQIGSGRILIWGVQNGSDGQG